MTRDPDESRRRGLTYRDAGVDIDAQDEALGRIKQLVRSTATAGVLSELGSFGGLFALDLAGCDSPVLVSSADGVGTKLRVAFLTGIHDTVGRDLVHHCVNDILVQGARPLFFMDYVATGRLEPGVLEAVVRGLAAGCREVGCALLGGETAEMPGFYSDGEYDVAGFIVGLADRARILDGSRIAVGDRLIGLPSAGLHTNGFSLARKIFFDVAGLTVDDRVDELGDTVGALLLAEHRCYIEALAAPLADGRLRLGDPAAVRLPAAGRQRADGRDVPHVQHGHRHGRRRRARRRGRPGTAPRRARRAARADRRGRPGQSRGDLCLSAAAWGS
jgi:phosphoribosylformylglycinamidine cyclo-ligase